jgi:hypothetical protein
MSAHGSTLLDELVVRLRAEQPKEATVAAAGGGGDGSPPETLDRIERRNQVGLLLLNGALERPGNFSPLVTLARFTTDIVRYIAELSALDHAEWIPRPQPREAPQLRRLAWQQELELRAERAVSEELRSCAPARR